MIISNLQFEDFLKNQFKEYEPSIEDEEFDEEFEEWRDGLSVDDWLEYGNWYAMTCVELDLIVKK